MKVIKHINALPRRPPAIMAFFQKKIFFLYGPNNSDLRNKIFQNYTLFAFSEEIVIQISLEKVIFRTNLWTSRARFGIKKQLIRKKILYTNNILCTVYNFSKKPWKWHSSIGSSQLHAHASSTLSAACTSQQKL